MVQCGVQLGLQTSFFPGRPRFWLEPFSIPIHIMPSSAYAMVPRVNPKVASSIGQNLRTATFLSLPTELRYMIYHEVLSKSEPKDTYVEQISTFISFIQTCRIFSRKHIILHGIPFLLQIQRSRTSKPNQWHELNPGLEVQQ
jgi:hypothetical protein